MTDLSVARFQWESLFSHQLTARDAAVTELANADRTQVLMACATGKTRVGPAVAFQLQAGFVVVYLPSLALVRQVLPVWMKSDLGKPAVFLCVCSDETVAGDTPVVTPEELRQEFGGVLNAVTTQPEVVGAFLSAPSMAMRIVFCTYQSADVLANGIPEDFRFDLGVFDEAHRTAGKDGMFTGPLQDQHTPIAKRVFMTATPKHISLRKRNADGEGETVYSMDDETVYGKVAYRLPIREAIEKKLIADYKILVSVIDDSMLPAEWQQRIGRGEAEIRDTEALAHAIALRAAMDRYGARKVVTFHDSVAEAESFIGHETIRRELGQGVSTFHINGKMPAGKRGSIMDGFETAEQGVITNARCLTEGVDVPEIDLVAFLHPRKSHIDIIQAIGRALRLPQGGTKTTGYILLPLYVSNLDNGGLGQALEESGYDSIYQVIQALKEQDEQVESTLLNAVRRPKDQPIELPFIEVSGPALHLDVLRQAISVECLDAVTDSWERYYAILLGLFERGEGVNVRQDAVIDGLKVGTWSCQQRTQHRSGNLPADRATRLEAIGFVWNKTIWQWEKHYAILKRMFDAGTSIEMEKRAVAIDGLNIGYWCSTQRAAFKNGKLSPDQIARLEAIGFTWNLLDKQWKQNYAALKCLFDAGKAVNVPDRFEIDGLWIGQWCRDQRKRFECGRLSADRIALLEAIGFVWDQLAMRWEQHYAILNQMFEKGESINMPQRTLIAGQKIGMWCHDQRKRYKLGKLSADRIAKLEAIGFKWSLK